MRYRTLICGLFASIALAHAAVAAPVVVNGGFESPVIPTTNGVEYTMPFGPALNGSTDIPGWTFGASTLTPGSLDGLGNGANFTNYGLTEGTAHAVGGAFDGNQNAFIQGTGTISQVVSGFSAGFYTFSVEAISRTNGGESTPEPTVVTIDGAPLTFGGTAEFQAITSGWGLVTSDPFFVGTGSHTLAISGTVPISMTVDDLVGLDDVSITTAAPEPGCVSLLGMGAFGLLARRRKA